MHSGARNPNRGGGVNPPDKDGSNLTITIPGGFSVASTRTAGNPRGAEGGDTGTRAGETRLTDTEEKDIDNLYMLLFAESDGGDPADPSDDELVSVEQIGSEAITRDDTDLNQYGVRVQLPTGTHRIVMLANPSSPEAASYTPIPSGQSSVTVGTIVWAPTNVQDPGAFAPSATALDYDADGNPTTNNPAGSENLARTTIHQYTWWEAAYPAGTSHTGDPGYVNTLSNASYATGTDGSICPFGWRLPTVAEIYALFKANTTKFTFLGTYNSDYNAADGVRGVEAAWASGSNPYYNNNDDGNTATGRGWYTGNAVPGELYIIGANSLFFPASGNSGGANNQGLRGYFWSSSELSASLAFNLLFLASDVYPADVNYKSYRFSVRCVRSAWASPEIGDVAAGQTYAQVRAALEGQLGGKLYEDEGPIPMWGETGLVTTGTDEDIHVDLHRAIARVDVAVNASVPASTFELTNVVVARPNNKYALIPALDKRSADDPGTEGVNESVPTAPSLPTGATKFTVAESVGAFTYTGSTFLREIYVPEAEIVGTDYADRMAIVVGGRYNSSADVTWYRLDFTDADGGSGVVDGLVDVVRNHLYTFTISAVRGPGQADAETAYNSQIKNMTVTVVDWNEVNFSPGL